MFNLFNKPKSGLNESALIFKPVDISRLEQAAIARAFARVFSTDDGRTVLSYLQAQTLQRALSATAPDEQIRYSEGQSALVAMILRQITQGRKG